MTSQPRFLADYTLPPRWRWLWLLLGIAALQLLLTAGIWLTWERITKSELDRLVAEIRARGEPILVEDFRRPDVADEENAAMLYSKAAGMLTYVTRPDPNPVDLLLADEWAALSPDSAEIDAFFKSVRAPLALAREARAMRQFSVHVNLKSPVISTLQFTHLSGLRQIAKMLAAAAWADLVRGDQHECIERIHDLMAISASLHEQHAAMIDALVGVSIGQLAISAIERSAPHLHLTPESARHAAYPAHRLAEESRIRALIAMLLDDQRIVTGFARGLQFERMLTLDIWTAVGEGRLSIRNTYGTFYNAPLADLGALSRPSNWQHAVQTIRTATAWMVEISPQSAPDRLIETANDSKPILSYEIEPRSPGEHPSLTAYLIGDFAEHSSQYQNTLRIMYRAIASQRLAATALAIRLFELDFGRRPYDLTELAPAYLPTVPIDPFSNPPRPIGYYLLGQCPVLYSIGMDRVDTTGTLAQSDADRYEQVLYLDGNPHWRGHEIRARNEHLKRQAARQPAAAPARAGSSSQPAEALPGEHAGEEDESAAADQDDGGE